MGTRIILYTKPCPKCGRMPMIWVTPQGTWWAACSNNGKPWHDRYEVAHINSRAKLIAKWNKLTDDLWVSGVTIYKKHKEREIPENAPRWIPIDEHGIFYRCSGCGYELAPRTITCPSCLKRMSLYPYGFNNTKEGE